MRLSVPLILALLAAPSAWAEPFVVRTAEVTDRKAVIATVEPIRQLVARARIGGTIASLTIREGDTVEAGAQVAVVTDQKLALQMQALDRPTAGSVIARQASEGAVLAPGAGRVLSRAGSGKAAP